MKKKLITVILILVSTLTTNAQINKKNWLVGGTGSFSSYKVIYESPINATVKTTSFNINPKIGFFPVDKFALGLSLGYSHTKETNSNSSISSTNEVYGFGPFIRYYYLKPEKISNIFSEFGYNNSYAVNDKSNTTNFYFSSGLALFFNSSIALEIGAKYLKFSNFNNGAKADDLRLEIGFQIHLEKDK